MATPVRGVDGDGNANADKRIEERMIKAIRMAQRCLKLDDGGYSYESMAIIAFKIYDELKELDKAR